MPERQPNAEVSPGVAWGPDPDRPHRPWVPILRPALAQPVKVTLLVDEIQEVGLHWLEGRSVPHTHPRESCLGCLRGNPPRTYHYTLGWGVYRGRFQICLVEISADAYFSTEEFKRGPLVGRELVLTRHVHHRGHVTARLSAEARQTPTQELPSIRAALEAIWAGVGKPPTAPKQPPGLDDQIPL